MARKLLQIQSRNFHNEIVEGIAMVGSVDEANSWAERNPQSIRARQELGLTVVVGGNSEHYVILG